MIPILIFIIIVLLINTLITNIQVRKIMKVLNDENPNEFRDKIKKFPKEYKSLIKRWGKF